LARILSSEWTLGFFTEANEGNEAEHLTADFADERGFFKKDSALWFWSAALGVGFAALARAWVGGFRIADGGVNANGQLYATVGQ